jgi:hypothetical protein
MDTKNGAPPQPSGLVTTSWVRDDFANGRRRFKLYAMHVPVTAAVGSAVGGSIESNRPRLAGSPVVIGEATIEVPNLEVAKILLAGLSEMLNKQPVEILQVKAG